MWYPAFGTKKQIKTWKGSLPNKSALPNSLPGLNIFAHLGHFDPSTHVLVHCSGHQCHATVAWRPLRLNWPAPCGGLCRGNVKALRFCPWIPCIKQNQETIGCLGWYMLILLVDASNKKEKNIGLILVVDASVQNANKNQEPMFLQYFFWLILVVDASIQSANKIPTLINSDCPIQS